MRCNAKNIPAIHHELQGFVCNIAKLISSQFFSPDAVLANAL